MKHLLCAALPILLFGNTLEAREATCFLQVERQIIIEGSCDFQADEDGSGSFSIASRDGKWFATVSIDPDAKDDPVYGVWNGDRANEEEEWGPASSLHGGLGALKRYGGCWASEFATVCAW